MIYHYNKVFYITILYTYNSFVSKNMKDMNHENKVKRPSWKKLSVLL